MRTTASNTLRTGTLASRTKAPFYNPAMTPYRPPLHSKSQVDFSAVFAQVPPSFQPDPNNQKEPDKKEETKMTNDEKSQATSILPAEISAEVKGEAKQSPDPNLLRATLVPTAIQNTEEIPPSTIATFVPSKSIEKNPLPTTGALSSATPIQITKTQSAIPSPTKPFSTKPNIFARLRTRIKNHPFLSTAIIGSSSIALISLGLAVLFIASPPASAAAAGIILLQAETAGMIGLITGFTTPVSLALLALSAITAASLLVWNFFTGLAKGISLGIKIVQEKQANKEVYEELPQLPPPLAPAITTKTTPPPRAIQQEQTITPKTAVKTIFIAATIAQQQPNPAAPATLAPDNPGAASFTPSPD